MIRYSPAMMSPNTPSDETRTAASPGLQSIEGRSSVPTLSLVYDRDGARQGERCHPGSKPLPLNRIAPVFPGGPLDDPDVSRTHAEIRSSGEGSFELVDLDSKNGTFVNDVPLSKGWTLNEGDVIRLGECLLLFHRLPTSEPPDELIDGFIGHSYAIRSVRAATRRYSRTPDPVLVTGESGTGKELVAGAIASIGRPRTPFLTLNTAVLSPQLVDSTLFGHERGAFTDAKEPRPGLFRSADGGTLFLDEIGELPVETQSRLLRVLEEGTVTPLGTERSRRVDVRIVAATNRDLVEEVKAKRFRMDLYSRLNHIHIAVPPLRERKEDIPLLAEHFASGGKFSSKAMTHLLLHTWPMNVRELKGVVTQMLASADDGEFLELSSDILTRLESHRSLAGNDLREADNQRDSLEASLVRNRGNVSRVAKEFGKDRANLYKLLKRFNLDPTDYR